MDIIGKWKFKGMNVPTEDGMVFYNKEDIPEDFADVRANAEAFDLEFLADGTYNMIGKAEGELAEQAEEEGMEIREDGYVVAFSAKWEDRNGDIYYDCGAEGTILDEEVDPFIKLEVNEDGNIWYNYGMCLYERI